MKLEIPFYSNDGDGEQCQQACMRSILDYYDLPDKTLEELDEITGRKPEQWTWTSQTAWGLHKLGIDCTYYLNVDITHGLDVQAYITDVFGEDAQHFIDYTNIDAVQTSTQYLIDHDAYKQRQPTQQELTQWLDEEQPLIILVDWNIITGKSGRYQGHAVVITGYDEKHFYVHHNGPGQAQAHMPIARETLMRAWTDETDKDLIVIHGPK